MSEYAATPARVVVHDPAATGALEVIDSDPGGRHGERTLFRKPPDPRGFAAEHAKLVDALEDAGVPVVSLADLLSEDEGWDEVRANPNHVYTRDSVIMLPWLPGWYIGAAMRMLIRRPEPPVTEAALSALELRELFRMPASSFLEGGDVIPLVRDGRRSLLLGFGPRSSRESVEVLCERLMPWALDEIIAIQLPEWRMNLDGVLVPVADDVVVAHPESIEGAFVRDPAGERPIDLLDCLRELGMEVIEVTREESMQKQACNCLCLGERRVISYDLAPRVVRALRGHDVEVAEIPASELIKGSGGPRCMTRPIYE